MGVPSLSPTFVGVDTTGEPIIFNDYSDLKYEIKGYVMNYAVLVSSNIKMRVPVIINIICFLGYD